MSDLISRLSELRCQYNCFDENERCAYHTLSEAIKALSDVPDTNVRDMISRQAAIDAIENTDCELTADDWDELTNAICNVPSADVQRWIPCSERLPEEPFGCLVTVWDTNPITMDDFENILPFFVGWDGEQWNDDNGYQCPFEVIAWMPLPKPYRGEQDE